METDESGHASFAALESAYRSCAAQVGVIGLGYVGLPLLLAMANAGFRVTGFDIDETKVTALNAGDSYIRQIGADQIAGALARNGPLATGDWSALAGCDAVIICVPTPLSPHREPDLSYIESTARRVVEWLRAGQLVVLESTTYPGTTDEVVRPILEESGLACGRDFFLAYSHEREDPGNSKHTTSVIPKVVGGEGPIAKALAVTLYEQVVPKVVAVSSTRVAEAAKLTENIFRSVNIALVNELKVVYEAMGIDVWEVIEAAKSKPFGFMPFYPGPGLGGHCIPIDPFYLTWKAREFEISTRFIELAGEINTMMPQYVINRLNRALDEGLGKPVGGSRVLLVGMAYKKNVDDIRESPALRIMHMLEDRKCAVEYYDPFVGSIPATREYASLMGKKSISWDPETLSSFDASIIVTDHDVIDYAQLAAHCPIVIDTRNAMRDVAGARIWKA
jgi:UDP-N-acetyl-D-glucosamine dehydrogenase